MWRRFCSWLLYRQLGWTTDITVDHPDKYIICLAPHTSNWDFLLGELYAGSRGWKINFLMKKEWFFWPLGTFFKSLGGVPVYRSKSHNLTDQLAEKALTSDVFHLCITPEGTRSRTKEWKKGFYFIAQKASIPILLYGIDYKRRLIKCTKVIVPSGNMEKDMSELKDYYKEFSGKNPDQFTTED